MRRKLKRIAQFVFVLMTSISPAETLTITARIVAYQGPMTCVNDNAYWSVILRVETPAKVSTRFLRVNFSQPCGRSPKWLGVPSTAQRYRLIRDKGRDAILDEFLSCEDVSKKGAGRSCPSIPTWKRTPGEAGSLPYGAKLPSYRSANLPLAPAV